MQLHRLLHNKSLINIGVKWCDPVVSSSQDSIEEQYGELFKRNVKESRKVCWKVIIPQVFASLENRLSNGSYMRPGGYKDFCSERDHSVMLYRSKTGKGVMVSCNALFMRLHLWKNIDTYIVVVTETTFNDVLNVD